MSNNNERTFTYELTNDTLQIASEDGLLAVAINNITAVTGTVEGDPAFVVDGKTTAPLTIVQGTPITVSASSPNGRLDKITITAPAGCTLQIMGQR